MDIILHFGQFSMNSISVETCLMTTTKYVGAHVTPTIKRQRKSQKLRLTQILQHFGNNR